MSNGGAETPPARVVVTRRMRAATLRQWRMKGGTSTSSSEIPSSPPPTRTVAPLVYVGVLAAPAGSNTDDVTPGVTAPARADAMT